MKSARTLSPILASLERNRSRHDLVSRNNRSPPPRRMLSPNASRLPQARLWSPPRTTQLEVAASKPSFRKMPTVCIQDFQIGPELGQGKFGKVFLVRHKSTGMMYSLKAMEKAKVLAENYVQQVVQEVRLQSQFDHPNIIRLYAFFDDSTYFYMLLEFACDRNLFRLVAGAGFLAEGRALELCKEVAEAVCEMHSRGVIHRDIKPQNITMIPKLCDFGWSSPLGTHRVLCGTVEYLSPEVASGRSHNEKVDVWSLGILLFELLAGDTPFAGKTQPQIIQTIKAVE